MFFQVYQKMTKKFKNFLWYTLEFFFIDTFFIKLSSTIKYKFNLNLSETQSHSYHLFDEQKIHYKKVKYSYNWVNGFSVLILILLALGLLRFCFFFFNYMWLGVAYLEIFGTLHNWGVKNHLFGYRNCFYYLFLFIWILFLWFEQVRFRRVEGYHTQKVNTGYRFTFILFLISEVMFFFSIFWAFFYFSVEFSTKLSYMWPHIRVGTIFYLTLSLTNTLILTTSGLFVVWSSNGSKVGNYGAAVDILFYITLKGVLFFFCCTNLYTMFLRLMFYLSSFLILIQIPLSAGVTRFVCFLMKFFYNKLLVRW